jgi:hypothetical protein
VAGFEILTILSWEPNRHFRISLVVFCVTQGEAKMSQQGLWERAAECARAVEATGDPIQREMLTYLRTLWINLANESPYLSRATLAEQTDTVSKIHANRAGSGNLNRGISGVFA